MDFVCVCDGLFALPVDEKAVSWTWCALAMGFSPCLTRKRPSHGLGVRLRWPFPPACRGKGRLMDLARVRDGLFPLPVEEKAVSWTWLAFAMAFSPCLSRKGPSHGLCARLRWPFPPACRGKGRLMALVCVCDGLSPLPVEEKAVSWTWAALGVLLRWSFPPACRGKGRLMDFVRVCDGLFPLPVEEN